MNSKAYIVAWLNLETLVITKAGIYSEPSPTTTALRVVKPIVLYFFEAKSYAKAHDRAAEWIRSETGKDVLGEPLRALLMQNTNVRTGFRA